MLVHRRGALLLAAAAIVASVAACSSAATAGNSTGPVKGRSLRIGAVFLDSQGFYGGVQAGFEAAAKAAGAKVQLVQSNPGDDVSAEASFVSTLVSSRVDAIIISAASQTASVPAIESAAKAGIPVICYNTCIDPADMSKYVAAYVEGDPVAFGMNTGEAAAEYFLKNHISNPKIAVVNCEFVEVCKLRRQGFESVLKQKVPGYQIVSNQAGTTEDQAVSVAGDQLRANPGLTAFYGESGGATYGATRALEAAGDAGKVVVFGSDMTTDIANALANGQVIKSDTDISGKVTGNLVWQQVQRILEGHKELGVIVADPITGYSVNDETAVHNWLTTHADGLP